MKIGTKLITGFLIVALVLISVGGLAIVLKNRVNDIKAENKIIRDKQADMLAFSFAIYEEHTMAVRCFTSYHPSDVDAYIEKTKSMHMINLAASASLISELEENTITTPLHVKITNDFMRVQEVLDNVNICFNENATLYTTYQLSQADVADVLTVLDEMTGEAMGNETIGIKSIIGVMDARIIQIEEEEMAALSILNNCILIGGKVHNIDNLFILNMNGPQHR